MDPPPRGPNVSARYGDVTIARAFIHVKSGSHFLQHPYDGPTKFGPAIRAPRVSSSVRWAAAADLHPTGGRSLQPCSRLSTDECGRSDVVDRRRMSAVLAEEPAPPCRPSLLPERVLPPRRGGKLSLRSPQPDRPPHERRRDDRDRRVARHIGAAGQRFLLDSGFSWTAKWAVRPWNIAATNVSTRGLDAS